MGLDQLIEGLRFGYTRPESGRVNASGMAAGGLVHGLEKFCLELIEPIRLRLEPKNLQLEQRIQPGACYQRTVPTLLPPRACLGQLPFHPEAIVDELVLMLTVENCTESHAADGGLHCLQAEGALRADYEAIA